MCHYNMGFTWDYVRTKSVEVNTEKFPQQLHSDAMLWVDYVFSLILFMFEHFHNEKIKVKIEKLIFLHFARIGSLWSISNSGIYVSKQSFPVLFLWLILNCHLALLASPSLSSTHLETNYYYYLYIAIHMQKSIWEKKLPNFPWWAQKGSNRNRLYFCLNVWKD